MKILALLAFIGLVSALLSGCQNENEIVKAEEQKFEAEVTDREPLLTKSEVSKVEVFTTKGIDPVVYIEAKVLGKFKDLFSSASKEPGIANATAPEFYLKLTDEEGDIQRLHLWLGNEGEQSMLMNLNETHTIYTLTQDMTAKLIVLIEK